MSGTEIARVRLEDEPRQPLAVVAAPGDPMAPIIAAAANGMPIESLRALMEMKKEIMAMDAQQAFNKAFAAFKAEAITVLKGTVIKDGPLKGKRHANLYDVVAASAAALGKHGLSTAWKLTKNEPNWMEVTCILRHDGGHSESVSMAGEPDKGPGRNAIQARGSAKTYLERYTLTAILGLAATDQDDDGQPAREKRPVGEYRDPMDQRPKDEPKEELPTWQEIYPEEWRVWEFAGRPVPAMDVTKFWMSWKSAILDPALCCRGAEWISDTMREQGIEWQDLQPAVPGCPENLEDCNPGNLWAVAAYLRKKVAAVEGGAK